MAKVVDRGTWDDDDIDCDVCGDTIIKGDTVADHPWEYTTGKIMHSWTHDYCAVKNGLELGPNIGPITE